MLRLLLDEHLSPNIATHLRRHLPDLVVYIGVIVRALTELWQQCGQDEWTDRVHYLTVPGR